MIKYGYLVFSILEGITVLVALILIVCLAVIIYRQGNFLEFINIYPKMIELLIAIILSSILVIMYVLMNVNEEVTLRELKKCCSNIH